MRSKRRTVVLLRWVLIIAFSYLVVLDGQLFNERPQVVWLIAVALISNLIVRLLPARLAASPLFDLCLVLFDATWVTFGLIAVPHISADLFVLYFLVMLVAALGESLLTIVSSAVVLSLVYGYTMWAQGETALSSTALLRLPFLFVVALFYGYFVAEVRGRRSAVAEAQLRERAKTELLAAVSHDLRSPLGNAQNLLELALDTEHGDAPDRSLILRAQVNIQRVVSLVSNLLQAASIENGQVPLYMAAAEPNEIVDDVLHLQTAAANVKNIAIERRFTANMPDVFIDTMQLGRIIANLLDNAIKYTPDGGRVVVETNFDPESFCISVHDTGPGLSPEQRQELFAPYRRLHIDGYTPGTGLGLFIVKRLTEAMGGKIEVKSNLGEGSTFSVVFPRHSAAPHSEAAPTVTPAIGSSAVRA